jgi:phosphate transport system protein
MAMAGMVEAAVERAIQSLLTGDSQLALTILEKEPLINQIEMQLDGSLLTHMAANQLPEDEMRFMSCLVKINKDLERMGDLAANVARKVLKLEEGNLRAERSALEPMAIAVSHLCRKALQALVRRDFVLAESALETAEAVHQYRDYASQRIRERLGTGSEVTTDVPLLLATRYLEQMASNAVNLAENLVFWLAPTQEDERVAC